MYCPCSIFLFISVFFKKALVKIVLAFLLLLGHSPNAKPATI
jgi:hypothetical protein